VAELHLPSTLPPLFPGLERHLEVDAASTAEAIEQLDARWPGFRDRLCDGNGDLRRHIHVYVDRERATLETPLESRSRVDVVAAISGG
jgi:sulfur-carrier protein